MKYRRLAGICLATLLLLSGCGKVQESTPPNVPAPDKQLTVYTSHKESVYMPVIQEFEERTGIWVNVVTGGTNELLEKIQAQGDHPQADVMFGGGVESLYAYRDLFIPYISSEAGAISDMYTSSDACWTPFSALPVVLIYNTKLVNPWDITGWNDLMDPRFRGQIAFADPQVSGSSFTALMTILAAMEGTIHQPMASFVQALDGKTLPSSGQVISQVSEGKAIVGITLEETAMKAMLQNHNIGIVYPVEGTSCLPDGTAIVKDTPHLENARKFINFTAGLDVQQQVVADNVRRSVRTDARPSQYLSPLSKIRLIQYDIDLVCDRRQDVLQAWKELTEGNNHE